MNLQAALYLIPVNISDAPLADALPAGISDVVAGIRCFIVENIRTARRFLRRLLPSIDIDSLTFYELNGHTDTASIPSMLEPLRQGMPVGVMSEAGCPAVADPGALVVAVAQREGLKVVPLVGPSSILMSLMASGFNGQGFSFNGYLPIEKDERIRKIKELENRARRDDMTQIFIETPYRNERLLRQLADTLRPDTPVCVACDITDPQNETIKTLPAKEWKKRDLGFLAKRPTIFLLYRP